MTTPREHARQTIAWAAHNGIPLNDQWSTDSGDGIELLLGTNERLAAITFLPGQDGQVVLFENGRRLEPSFDARELEPLRAFLTGKPPRVMLEVSSPLPPPVTVNEASPEYTAEIVLRARFEKVEDVALLLAALETARVYIERAP